MYNLPDELLLTIFHHVNYYDSFQVAKVCKKFKRLIYDMVINKKFHNCASIIQSFWWRNTETLFSSISFGICKDATFDDIYIQEHDKKWYKLIDGYESYYNDIILEDYPEIFIIISGTRRVIHSPYGGIYEDDDGRLYEYGGFTKKDILDGLLRICNRVAHYDVSMHGKVFKCLKYDGRSTFRLVTKDIRGKNDQFSYYDYFGTSYVKEMFKKSQKKLLSN